MGLVSLLTSRKSLSSILVVRIFFRSSLGGVVMEAVVEVLLHTPDRPFFLHLPFLLPSRLSRVESVSRSTDRISGSDPPDAAGLFVTPTPCLSRLEVTHFTLTSQSSHTLFEWAEKEGVKMVVKQVTQESLSPCYSPHRKFSPLDRRSLTKLDIYHAKH